MVEPGSARIRLKVHQQLAKMHPADLADILEDLGRVERKEIVAALDPETAASALSEAEPSVQAAVVEGMHVDRAADLLEEMAPDEAADILGDLPEERLQAVLDAMEDEDADEVRELLTFREDSAGGLMTTGLLPGEGRMDRRRDPGDAAEGRRGPDPRAGRDPARRRRRASWSGSFRWSASCVPPAGVP